MIAVFYLIFRSLVLYGSEQIDMNEAWDEHPDEIEINFGYYYHLLKAQWLSLLVVAFGAGIVAFAVSSLQESVYRSTATIFVDSRRGNGSADFTDIRTSESLAETYAELITSRTVLEKSAEVLNVEKLEGSISASPVAGTQLIRISAESTNPGRAAIIANTVSQVLIDQIQEIETSGYTRSEGNFTTQLEFLDEQVLEVEEKIELLLGSTDAVDIEERTRLETVLTEYNRDYSSLLRNREQVRLDKFEATSNMNLFEEAEPNLSPVRPRTTLNTAIGVILGLMTMVGFILGRELLDDSVRDLERLSMKLGVPILGQILHFDADNERLITSLKPRSPAAESFRSIRLNLDFASPDTELKSLLVTSAAPSEGKSTLSSNLGSVMAQGGKRTVLIDSDLRKPRQHRTFGVMNMQGLSNLFLSSANISLDAAMTQTAVENLFLVPSGSLPPNPSELLYSRRAGEIIRDAEDATDMVIVDAPPVTIMTDAAALARHVDGVIVVVRFGETKQRVLIQAIEALRHVDAKILGFVLTDVGRRDGRYGYYYQYRYGNQYQSYYDVETPSTSRTWRDRFRKKNAPA